MIGNGVSNLSRCCGYLASLRLTLLGMLTLCAAALVNYRQPDLSVLWLAGPLTLLAINLITALIYRPQFRRQGGLLVFHLCLLAIIVLAAAGLMTRMQGRVEIIEGQVFDPATVTTVRQGPWHPWQLDQVNFKQGAIEVEYAPNVTRGRTRSELILMDDEGVHYPAQIGDTQSQPLAGYRFITTFNKGYAVLLTWQAAREEMVVGAVHMPSYPLLEWDQQNKWTSPQGETIALELKLPAPPRDHAWTLRSKGAYGQLVVGGDTVNATSLDQGESIMLSGGVLRFDGLRLWMGYRIEFNPFLPWLFAAAMVGVVGLAWHFWRRLWSIPAPLTDSVTDGVRAVPGGALGSFSST